MIDNFSQALTLMREAFEDAAAGAVFLPCVDMAAEVDGAQRVINAWMRRFVTRRDGHCLFPGCRRAARGCEPDHVIPYSRGGPTSIWNLASLCKHHHRVKHEAGWALTMSRDGECIWTDPHGRQYATHPVNHHDLTA